MIKYKNFISAAPGEGSPQRAIQFAHNLAQVFKPDALPDATLPFF